MHTASSEFLTALMRTLTSLGDAGFLLVFFSLGYWLVHRRVFARVFVLLTVAALINSVLKATFRVPRPIGETLVHADGWSFPSGHAMTAAAIWPALAVYLLRYYSTRREKEGNSGNADAGWAANLIETGIGVFAAVLVSGIAYSRVYLGVHTVRDVVWGVIFGCLLAALAVHLGDRPLRPWLRIGADGQAAFVTLAVGLTLAFLPRNGDPAAAMAGGGLVGFWIGAALARLRYGEYEAWGAGRRLGVIFLGLGVAFGLRVGLKSLLADLPALGLPALSMEAAQSARFLIIGLWVALLAPRLFVAAGFYRHPRAKQIPSTEQ